MNTTTTLCLYEPYEKKSFDTLAGVYKQFVVNLAEFDIEKPPSNLVPC